MGLLIIFFFLSIVLSFLCSIWESALLSITPSFISRKVQEGQYVGERLRQLKEDIDRPLSAILTLNTIAHTVGAIGVGAQAGKLFGTEDIILGPVHLNYESLIAAAMTLAILILSEIIPKTLGANLWKELAPFTVRSIDFLLVILAPFVWMSQGITRRMKKDKERSVLSRADFVAIAKHAEETGQIEEGESEIIHNLLHLDKLSARDIMTPRPVMVMADENMSLKEFFETHKPLRFSRIPLYDQKSDNVSGMVLKDVMLEQLVEGKGDLKLSDIKREINVVKEDIPLPTLFNTLTNQRSHMAIVVDEFGSISGLVTVEDLFETLLGMEIVDEYDKVADLQSLAREKWEERARSMGLIREEDKGKKDDG